MNSDGTGPTFRERSAWATLLSTVVLYGGAWTAALQFPGNAVFAVVCLVGAMVLQVALLIFVHVILAIRSPSEPDDERDRWIGLRSARWSNAILGVGIWLALVAVIGQRAGGTGEAAGGTWLDPLWIGHLLFAVFIVAECVRLGTTAVAYRRGA